MLHRSLLCLVAASAILLAAAPDDRLDWAFPGRGPAPATAAGRIERLPGSPRRFTTAALKDFTRAPDWFPAEHPPAPRAVLVGSRGAFACGYCHLVTGAGRTENAQLRGQPVDYIEEQVKAFASGARRSAVPSPPTDYMVAAARLIRPADLHAAAVYFAALEPQQHARVIETSIIPRATAEGYLYRFDPTAREPLGNRIVEGATDAERHRLHDPHERSVAYVPVGAVARGEALALHGTTGVPACASCHTTHFVGIGGESPTYLVRQLAGFRSRRRNDPGAAPMQAVSSTLTDDQLIDLAAYIGSRPAWTRAQMAADMARQ